MFAYQCAQVPDADLYIQCLCTAPFVTADTLTRAIQQLIAAPEADSLIAVQRTKQYLWQDGAPAYGNGRIPNSVNLPETITEAMSLYIVRHQQIGRASCRERVCQYV